MFKIYEKNCSCFKICDLIILRGEPNSCDGVISTPLTAQNLEIILLLMLFLSTPAQNITHCQKDTKTCYFLFSPPLFTTLNIHLTFLIWLVSLSLYLWYTTKHANYRANSQTFAFFASFFSHRWFVPKYACLSYQKRSK